jgi:signal transduction histidine kinase
MLAFAVALSLHRPMSMHAPRVLLRAAAHLGGPRVLALPLLRVLAIVLGALWIALTPPADPRRGAVATALLAFALYSAAVIAALWAWPPAVLRRSTVVLLGDIAFALVLIALSGGAGSTLFLALLLIAGLHSYYHGMRRGIAGGLVVATGYVFVSWPTLDGEIANVVVRLATLVGTVVGIGILADLEANERRKVTTLTASVNQAEKLAALGTLAAGIAHEINNPIGVITSRVELMRLDADAHHLPKEVRDDLDVVHRHARRVARITQGLLSFARKSSHKRTSVDLNQIVDETLVLLEHPLTRGGVTIATSRALVLPRITGDPNALQQVLVNLLTNARDAITGPGRIEVRTHVSPDGHEVRLSVHDTGPGIPPETLPRIFDPFFTTKAEGTGLGLAISYGIVRDHGGTIAVDSRRDHGTTFTVTLPVAHANERA